jgi:uncharacterized protein
MLRKTLCCIVLLVCAGQCLAQETSTPATREDVLRLFSALRVQQQVESVQAAVRDNMGQVVNQLLGEQLKDLDAPQRAKVQAFIAKIQADAENSYPIIEMLQDMVPVYEANYSQQEIDALVAFYSSPMGRRLLDKQPKVTREAMAAITPKLQERMRQQMAKIQAETEQLIQELAKERNKAKPSSPPPPKS